MTATALAPPRFVRRTQLGANEYRKNFHQIDAEVINAVTSAAADRVTPLMSKIYLRLASAPPELWERDGVLYFRAGEVAGCPVKASKVLYGLLGVASATAHKALHWMHEQGIIGYFAGKNGAGIRIFLNRATGSIGMRRTAAGKKILPFVHSSNGAGAGSTVEPAFNDSFADLETLDTDLDPHAPKNGADENALVKNTSTSARAVAEILPPAQPQLHHMSASAAQPVPGSVWVDEIVRRLKLELEPDLLAAAQQATADDHKRTREWLENRGLPKAARVAQRETYNVLRQHGVISVANERARAELAVGRQDDSTPVPKELTPDELREMAEICVAMLETQGQAIDVTLSKMSMEAGGFLLPADAPKVRESVAAIMGAHRQIE
ncbi:MAG TPA: hypothetical protein VD835_10400 [Pyrinomonadaceae bacterium]|nr:hypothetical protein [Pyrinomonadaceae bacterium]